MAKKVIAASACPAFYPSSLIGANGLQLNLEPVDIGKYDTRKIIDGSVFGSDPWRVHTLMLIAIGKSGDVQIVSEPRKMMAIAIGLAIAGMPKVIEMLKDGDADPIWNLSDCVEAILREKAI
jgi:hypothetical protein